MQKQIGESGYFLLSRALKRLAEMKNNATLLTAFSLLLEDRVSLHKNAIYVNMRWVNLSLRLKEKLEHQRPKVGGEGCPSSGREQIHATFAFRSTHPSRDWVRLPPIGEDDLLY